MRLPYLRRRLLLSGLFGLAALGMQSRARAAACSSAGDHDLQYGMTVGGVTIAEIELRSRCTGMLTLVELELENRGVAALFAGRSRVSMTALVGTDDAGKLQPAQFRATYTKPDRVRETALDFGPNGELTNVETYNRGRPQESPVPEELRPSTVDPLTVLLRLGAWVTAGPEAGDSAAHALFEGRKRADLDVVYRGQTRITHNGRTLPVHHLEAALLGLAGFDADDRLVSLPGEPRRWLDLYATTDAVPVPLLVSTTDGGLPTRIALLES